jgi:hypothetical protein
MDDARRSVDCSARDFLEAWWRGDGGPVSCARCSACCHYDASAGRLTLLRRGSRQPRSLGRGAKRVGVSLGTTEAFERFRRAELDQPGGRPAERERQEK